MAPFAVNQMLPYRHGGLKRSRKSETNQTLFNQALDHLGHP
jgi:hypothetical protein